MNEIAIYINENSRITDMFVNVGDTKKKVTSGWVCGEESPIKIFESSQVQINEPISWLYTLDEQKNIIELYSYIGSETKITVYSSYVVNNKKYNTAIGRYNPNNINYMFSNCGNIKSIKFSEGINLSNTIVMTSMFSYCTSLTYLDVSMLDVSEITGMASLFSGCSSLTSLDLSNWNTKKVTIMSYMFKNCKNLKTIYVDKLKWSTSQLEYKMNMFTNCGTSSVTYK